MHRVKLDPFELHRLRFIAHTEYDSDHRAPWEENDGHGVVTDWIVDPEDGEYADRTKFWVLNESGHGGARLYDVVASLEKATREQWGLSPEELAKLRTAAARQHASDGREPAREEITRRAVQRDYEYLRGWCQDDWHYIGVVVRLDGTDIEASLWGIESNAEAYINEVAQELAGNIIDEHVDTLEKQVHALGELLDRLKAAQAAQRTEVRT